MGSGAVGAEAAGKRASPPRERAGAGRQSPVHGPGQQEESWEKVKAEALTTQFYSFPLHVFTTALKK